jgi:hypothetical protein
VLDACIEGVRAIVGAEKTVKKVKIEKNRKRERVVPGANAVEGRATAVDTEITIQIVYVKEKDRRNRQEREIVPERNLNLFSIYCNSCIAAEGKAVQRR